MKNTIFIDGEEYRYIEIRHRGKYIAKDGKAVNPYRKNQKCTIHYNQDGYPCFGGHIPVHLYVAHAWVDGYFKGAEVNHKDFNRNNYKAENLEWITHQENIAYTIKHNYDTFCDGRKGVKNGRAIFTEEEVLLIRKMYNEGNSIVDIVRYFYPNLQTRKQYRSIHSTFANIVHYRTWKHI